MYVVDIYIYTYIYIYIFVFVLVGFFPGEGGKGGRGGLRQHFHNLCFGLVARSMGRFEASARLMFLFGVRFGRVALSLKRMNSKHQINLGGSQTREKSSF